MYTITKEVYFCYGHRLMKHAGKCRHLHGHSVKAAICLSSQTLNDQGMVCDFSDIALLASEFIESKLDHTLLLHQDDPLVALLSSAEERFMLLPEHPTAEYLAQMIFQFIKQRGYPVKSVTLWETSSSAAEYRDFQMINRFMPDERSYWLAKLCETNYLKLNALIPDLIDLPEMLVACADGKPSLYIKRIDRSPYTLTLELTHCFSLGFEVQLEPAVKLRVYLDARAVEVLKDHERSHVRFGDKASSLNIMDHKWTLNYFLSQWLDHCLGCDYRFAPQSIEAQQVLA